MGRRTLSRGALGALGITAALAAWTIGADARLQSAQAAATKPVVVELFTSQGCSSCPPADALLGDLAKQPGVLALSFHVDYWDYIGWKDPFAAAQYTERQRDYAAKLGLRYVYTPQMVIDGRHDAVGSNRRDVTRAISESENTPAAVEVKFDGENGGRVMLSAGKAPPQGATVWMVTFDANHDTDVLRGENRGRDLHNSNVVREMTPLGTWTGEAKTFALDFAKARSEGRSGCAVIVQDGRGGPVIGAAVVDLNNPSG